MKKSTPAELHIARLLVRNYSAYRVATQAHWEKRPLWVVYRVETFTPGHYYLGVSGRIERRVYEHLTRADTDLFVGRYGARQVHILAILETREEAERAEWQLWERKYVKDGTRVGCHSFTGMGLA